MDSGTKSAVDQHIRELIRNINETLELDDRDKLKLTNDLNPAQLAIKKYSKTYNITNDVELHAEYFMSLYQVYVVNILLTP